MLVTCTYLPVQETSRNTTFCVSELERQLFCENKDAVAEKRKISVHECGKLLSVSRPACAGYASPSIQVKSAQSKLHVLRHCFSAKKIYLLTDTIQIEFMIPRIDLQKPLIVRSAMRRPADACASVHSRCS